MREIFFPKGRFWKDSGWTDFLRMAAAAVKESREKTESEQRIIAIQENIDKMIVPFARVSADGDDPKSIAMERIKLLSMKAEKERKEKEIEIVRKEVEMIEKLLKDRRSRLQALNADKTFGGMRQAEIEAARARAEEKLAV